MKIKVEDIPSSGLEIEFKGSEDVLSEAIANIELPLDVSIDPKLHGSVTLNRDGDQILISGDIKVGMTLKCSRCLNQFDTEDLINLNLYARRTIREDMDYEQVSDLEDNEVFICHGEIDLSELIVQEICLDIPMKPLCKDDCPELCSTCGSIIGSNGCFCARSEATDPRWEKLVTLKSRLTT